MTYLQFIIKTKSKQDFIFFRGTPKLVGSRELGTRTRLDACKQTSWDTMSTCYTEITWCSMSFSRKPASDPPGTMSSSSNMGRIPMRDPVIRSIMGSRRVQRDKLASYPSEQTIVNKVNVMEINSFTLVYCFFKLKRVIVEVLLKHLICEVDAKLLEWIVLKYLCKFAQQLMIRF